MSNIWERRTQLQRERHQMMKSLMQEYDNNVYHPAMQALMAECAVQGHSGGNYHENGLGWSWFYCSKCGAAYDKTGPNGERR
jgi:hypothetical protein